VSDTDNDRLSEAARDAARKRQPRYTYGTPVTFRHVFSKETARKAMFTQVAPQHDDLTRDAEFPFPYIDKKFWKGMGSPEVIEVTIRSMKLREGDDDAGP